MNPNNHRRHKSNRIIKPLPASKGSGGHHHQNSADSELDQISTIQMHMQQESTKDSTAPDHLIDGPLNQLRAKTKA
jgi:hypothetical protein